MRLQGLQSNTRPMIEQRCFSHAIVNRARSISILALGLILNGGLWVVESKVSGQLYTNQKSFFAVLIEMPFLISSLYIWRKETESLT